ncbi:MAG TPA: hypothetical protein VHD31_00860 [Candidatus Paceibacterota bacterium]|nr:hypothetical protein [Candidatus Paceibacterota bacterium]
MKKARDRRVVKGALSPVAKKIADEFFAHKKKHPEVVDEKDMTPLQRRMQSGGPGITRKQFRGVLEEAVKIVPKKKLPRN